MLQKNIHEWKQKLPAIWMFSTATTITLSISLPDATMLKHKYNNLITRNRMNKRRTYKIPLNFPDRTLISVCNCSALENLQPEARVVALHMQHSDVCACNNGNYCAFRYFSLSSRISFQLQKKLMITYISEVRNCKQPTILNDMLRAEGTLWHSAQQRRLWTNGNDGNAKLC